MFTVIIAIVLGALLGKVVGSSALRLNDRFFTVLSTVVVFLMGVALGLSREIFAEAKSLLFTSFVLAIVPSVGSILFVFLLTKFSKVRDV